MPDDDDRPRDASSAADHGRSDPARNDPALDDTEWANAVAPDDIRALAGDIAAYRREVRTARRRARTRRWFARPGVTSLSMIAAGFAIAAVLATLFTVLEPRSVGKPPAALPLAHPSVAVGQPGGLLPDVALQAFGGNSVGSRALRPGVLALIPLHCQCVPLLNSLASGAYAETLPLIVVAPNVVDAEAATLSGQLNRGADVYYDSSDALATDLGARGVTLVILDRDGTIYDLQRDVPSAGSSNLAGLLQTMLAPKARTSG